MTVPLPHVMPSVANLSATTKAGRLRALMPDIEQRLAAGVRIADLLAALEAQGLNLSVATLKSYLYRFRKAAKADYGAARLPAEPRRREMWDSAPRTEVTDRVDSARTAGPASTPGLLRHINTARCLRFLRSGASPTRAELARALGMTRATAGHAIRELIDSGLVVEHAILLDESRRGRPGSGVRLNPGGAYSVGIDVSSLALTGVLVDFDMRVVTRIHEPIGTNGIADIVDMMALLAVRLIDSAGINRSRVQGLCVSVPGLVDRVGRVIVAPFLRWRDVSLQALLSAHPAVRWKVSVCNDAAAFANAERTAAEGDDADNILLVLLTEGLGGALMQRGRLFSGAHGYAGELGHMVMGATPSSIPTRTFEMLAGYERFRPFIPAQHTFEEGLAWLAASGNENPTLEAAFEGWAEVLATGLLNLIYLLDPEKIIFGGQLSVLLPRIEHRLQDLLSEHLLHGFHVPALSITSFGADGAAIGAASLVRDELFALPELGHVST